MKGIRIGPPGRFSVADPRGALQTLGIEVVLDHGPFYKLNAAAPGPDLMFQQELLRRAQGAHSQRGIESSHPVDALSTHCHVPPQQSVKFIVRRHFPKHCSMDRFHPSANQMASQSHVPYNDVSLSGYKRSEQLQQPKLVESEVIVCKDQVPPCCSRQSKIQRCRLGAIWRTH